MTVTILLAVVIACRVRVMRRRGRKRNLSSDADGDYLVNGMYLYLRYISKVSSPKPANYIQGWAKELP